MGNLMDEQMVEEQTTDGQMMDGQIIDRQLINEQLMVGQMINEQMIMIDVWAKHRWAKNVAATIKQLNVQSKISLAASLHTCRVGRGGALFDHYKASSPLHLLSDMKYKNRHTQLKPGINSVTLFKRINIERRVEPAGKQLTC